MCGSCKSATWYLKIEIDVKDNTFGKTALQAAAQNERTKIVQLLIDTKRLM
ncbi:MAG: hypothetical protein ACR5KV_00045 [Wolbachia sp.]